MIPLAGDASTRRYYRVVDGKQSWVLMEWEPFDDSQSFPFLSVQSYFDKNAIRVPKIIDYDKEKGLFLLEDLGDLTLERRFWEFQNQDVVLPFYRKALDQLIKIHSLSFEDKDQRNCTAYNIEFSVEKLLWEMNYAKKYLLKELLELELSPQDEKTLEGEFLDICQKLYQSPQVICHRDFHSRNVMLSFEELVIIDFQDARLGPPAYDLVSLFFDSYVDLSPGSIDGLMKYYIDHFPHFNDLNLSQDQWTEFFHLQTIQRCFKACGSFASFKITRDDDRYLGYIQPTLERVLRWLPLYKSGTLLETCIKETQSHWENL